MFESLSERLQDVFRELGRRGRLGQAEVDSALREIRLALLEADVHFRVVKILLENVRQRALGQEVSRALNPAQQVIRIIHEELVEVLGGPQRLALPGRKPRPIMLVGLQGSGKTTTAAKLTHWLRARGERVWLLATDIHRPAAVEQLRSLGAKLDVPVYFEAGLSASELAMSGIRVAELGGASVVVLDTAGRSQVDPAMMAELQAIRESTEPVETLLVADAMTGQEAVNIARGFQEGVGLTGLILTKMDGDARGGAAISMRAVTGLPIKFIGTGEHTEDLETFEADRLASRILGMGDVLSLIEKAEVALDQKQSEATAAKMVQGEFTLDDFADQLTQVRRMGPIGKLLDMVPGVSSGLVGQIDASQAESQLTRTQAILQSMTRLERRKPEILNASRKRRIAAGSGTSVQEVNQLLRQYRQMRKLFKQLSKRGLGSGLTPWMR